MRVSDLGLQQLLLQSFQRVQDSAQTHQIQLSSGKKFQTYGGYGADALRLISSEGIVARATAFENAGQIALTRLQIQESSLSIIADTVAGARDGFVRTLATGASELLLPELEAAAQRILSALNTQVGGVYLFGGDNGLVQPVAAQSLDDIANAGSIDALFTEGARMRLAVEEGVDIDGGPLASEIAGDLLAELQELANAEATLGPFEGELTDAQRDFIVEKSARFAEIADDLNQSLGLNAVAQGQAAEASDRNRQRRDMAEIVAADIEDVDIAEALTRLNQDQLALEAAARSLAQASELSLINFL